VEDLERRDGGKIKREKSDESFGAHRQRVRHRETKK
jgi:hypothetical protein